VHKGLALGGALTNGLVRDLGDLDPAFPVIAGGIGPSHGFVHVTQIGTGATVMGLRVEDGDLIHADRHGAIVIPADILSQLEAAITKLQATETLILDPAHQDGFDLEMLRTAWAAFEAART
ncbi:MAG: RraA family protein, partial [Pseudomonadota bacterium]